MTVSADNVRVTLYRVELYPVFEIADEGGDPVEIPAALAERAQAAWDEFRAVQTQLREIHRKRA